MDAEDEINTNFIHDKYGYCYYVIEPGKTPIIFNLFVRPKYRRQGHAKRLLQCVIDEIRNTGYRGIIDIEVRPREESVSAEKLTLFYASMDLNVLNSASKVVSDKRKKSK